MEHMTLVEIVAVLGATATVISSLAMLIKAIHDLIDTFK